MNPRYPKCKSWIKSIDFFASAQYIYIYIACTQNTTVTIATSLRARACLRRLQSHRLFVYERSNIYLNTAFMYYKKDSLLDVNYVYK